jgi:hypothetical protein
VIVCAYVSGQLVDVMFKVDVADTAFPPLGAPVPEQLQLLLVYKVKPVSPSTVKVELSADRLHDHVPALAEAADNVAVTSHPAALELMNLTKPVAGWFTDVIEVSTIGVRPPAIPDDRPVASDIRPAGTSSPPVTAPDERPVTIVKVSLSVAPHTTLLSSKVAAPTASTQ